MEQSALNVRQVILSNLIYASLVMLESKQIAINAKVQLHNVVNALLVIILMLVMAAQYALIIALIV